MACGIGGLKTIECVSARAVLLPTPLAVIPPIAPGPVGYTTLCIPGNERRHERNSLQHDCEKARSRMLVSGIYGILAVVGMTVVIMGWWERVEGETTIPFHPVVVRRVGWLVGGERGGLAYAK